MPIFSSVCLTYICYRMGLCISLLVDVLLMVVLKKFPLHWTALFLFWAMLACCSLYAFCQLVPYFIILRFASPAVQLQVQLERESKRAQGPTFLEIVGLPIFPFSLSNCSCSSTAGDPNSLYVAYMYFIPFLLNIMFPF